jgi:hypothetical protein
MSRQDRKIVAGEMEMLIQKDVATICRPLILLRQSGEGLYPIFDHFVRYSASATFASDPVVLIGLFEINLHR